MKQNLHQILSLLYFLVFTSISVFAQEAGSPSFESYDTEHLRDREKIISTPGESIDPQKPIQPNKDSATVKIQRNVYKPSPVVPKDQNKPKDQHDDGILSFNFLYYLIQKYKMQDIVD